MARLPQPGGDNGNWGSILNDFLAQSLKGDGAIKDSAVTATTIAPNAVTATALAPNSVTNTALASDSVNATTIADGSITIALLATSIQTSLGKADTALQTAPVTKVAGKTGDVALLLADLTDINATGAANNQVLAYNSTTNKWSASTVSSTTVSDASTTSKGIIQLAGDLGGNNNPAAPAITTGAISTAKIADNAVTTVKITDGNVTKAKLEATVQTSLGKADTALQSADLTATEKTANKGQANGYASLDTNSLVPTAQLGTGTASNTTYLRGDGSWATSTAAPDATTSAKGVIQLAGDLGGTATSPTVPGLANKLDTATATSTYAPKASPTFTGVVTVPTPTNNTDASTKAYVDTQLASATVADATTSAKGKIQLAGDLAGTAASPTVPGLAGKLSTTTANTTYAQFINLARNPDLIITGTINRDGNGAITTAGVTWPDGTPGTLTTDTASSVFPGAVDAYHVTYGSPATKTFTQSAITRDSTSGLPTNIPAIIVS